MLDYLQAYLATKRLDLDAARYPTVIKELLDGNRSATGARATWTRLKFLQTHLRYPIVLPDRPAKKAVHGGNEDTEGGVCVEPEMVLRLVDMIPALQSKQDWRLGCLLGALYILSLIHI